MMGCPVACLFMRDAQAEMKEVRNFPVPRAHCAPVIRGRILTSVGTIPYEREHKDYEVVADVKLGPDPVDSLAEFYDPSIAVYDEKCEPLWHQSDCSRRASKTPMSVRSGRAASSASSR